ncbi:MAG: hypothetical protein IT423_05605 [Pirellulaceae bacterium]|nr:hypothetical protein [Pirellulaceae bacterium]
MSLWNMSLWNATLHRRVLAISMAALGSVMAPNIVCAQKPKNENRNATADTGVNPAQAMEIAKVEGTLAGAQLGKIKITTPDKKEVFLIPDNETVVNYSAQAEPVWLTGGLMIRFSANFDSTGKPTAPLKALEVFTPVMRGRMSPEQMREQTPGVFQEGKAPPEGAKGLFAENNRKPNQPAPKGKPSTKKETPAPVTGQAYRVVGKLVNLQNNVMTVLAGQPMQIELDPAAVISVTAHDLASAMNMAVQGDAVSVSGLRNPAQPEVVKAEQIVVKAAKKRTQAVTQTRPGRTATTRGKDKDKNADSKDDKSNDNKKPGSTNKKPQ